MEIVLTVSVVVLVVLSLVQFARIASLREDIEHLRRTSRANHDRADESLRALRSELVEKIEKVKVAAPRAAGTTVGPSWFSPKMTIKAALAVHPGVKDALASLHIGGCSSCASSENETLEQAAVGHRVDLDEMLDKLNAVMANGAQAPAPKAPEVVEAEKLASAEKGLPPATGGRVMLSVGKVPSAT